MKRFIIRKILTASLTKSQVKYPTKIVFADGSSFEPVPGRPEITITFKTGWAEWRTIIFNYVGFCEGYRNSEIDIDGPDALAKFVRMNYAVPAQHYYPNPLGWLMKQMQEYWLDNRNFRTEFDNLNRHYGLPAEFFHFMCGELYGYTEGYYETGRETQNEAQFKKYDYMCRKLCLKRGDKLIEVGTAWGTMALLAAKRYGAKVVNYGLVPEQNRVFEERVKRMGLQDRITNVVKNARDLGKEKGKYDKYVSLGVFEHAGLHCYKEWIANIEQALKPGGIGVMTFTGYMKHHLIDYFVGKYIWRGCYLASLASVLKVMEEHNLNVVDVENSRFFYADTMRVMLSKMNEYWTKIQAIDPRTFDERFRRVWNMYYTASSESFYAQYSQLHAFQLVFVKGRGDVYPRTRAFLYEKPFDLSDMKDYEVPLSGAEKPLMQTVTIPELSFANALMPVKKPA